MTMTMHDQLGLPARRGPLSGWVLDRLRGRSFQGPMPTAVRGKGLSSDLQLALYLCYEPHFGPLPDVSDDVEWDPELIRFRRSLEAEFERALVLMVGRPAPAADVRQAIPALIAADDGPSLSRHMETVGTLDEMREFVIHRSAYQLKEGDAHTFAIPRLRSSAKQILVAIQAGEYGADVPGRTMHSELFAQTMRGLGLDDRANAYLDQLPASALMIPNLISMFGLNRRWRGALVGHLSVFEMTSVPSMRRYARGLDRMRASEETRRFYDVHILADAEHEVMALEMAADLVEREPELAGDVLFGARCVFAVERIFAEQLLCGWRSAARRCS